MLTTLSRLPEFIERGRTVVLRLELYDGEDPADLDEEHASTVRITFGARVLVDSAPVTWDDGVPTYELLGSATADEPLSEDGLIEWTVLLNDVPHIIRRECHLVLRTLYPVVRLHDLYTRHADLERQEPPSAPGSWLRKLADAWDTICARLRSAGRRPYLVMSSWALKDVHTYLALSFIYRDLATYATGRGLHMEMADDYSKLYESAWKALKLTYDFEQSGIPDSSKRGTAGTPVVYLS